MYIRNRRCDRRCWHAALPSLPPHSLPPHPATCTQTCAHTHTHVHGCTACNMMLRMIIDTPHLHTPFSMHHPDYSVLSNMIARMQIDTPHVHMPLSIHNEYILLFSIYRSARHDLISRPAPGALQAQLLAAAPPSASSAADPHGQGTPAATSSSSASIHDCAALIAVSFVACDDGFAGVNGLRTIWPSCLCVTEIQRYELQLAHQMLNTCFVQMVSKYILQLGCNPEATTPLHILVAHTVPMPHHRFIQPLQVVPAELDLQIRQHVAPRGHDHDVGFLRTYQCGQLHLDEGWQSIQSMHVFDPLCLAPVGPLPTVAFGEAEGGA